MSPSARLAAAALLLAVYRWALAPAADAVDTGVDPAVEALMVASRDAFAGRRWADAVEPTRTLVQRFPSQQVYSDRLARTYAALDRPTEEAAAWEQFVRTSPTPEDACPAMGEAYWRAGERERALDAFTRCRDFDPLAADGWYFLGRAYQRDIRHAEALAAFEEAVRVDPLHTDSRVALAGALLRIDRVAEARDVIAPAVDRVRRDPDVHLLLGLAEQRLGRRREARAALERAAALADTYVDVHVALGILDFVEGRRSPARDRFERALALDPARREDLRVWLARVDGATP